MQARIFGIVVIITLVGLNTSPATALAADEEELINQILDQKDAIDQAEAMLSEHENRLIANADRIAETSREMRQLQVMLRRANRAGDKRESDRIKTELQKLNQRIIDVTAGYDRLKAKKLPDLESSLRLHEKKLQNLVEQLANLRRRGGQGGAGFKIGQALSAGQQSLQKIKILLTRLEKNSQIRLGAAVPKPKGIARDFYKILEGRKKIQPKPQVNFEPLDYRRGIIP